MHGDAKPVPPPPTQYPNLSAGICLCSDFGKDVKVRGDKLSNYMRQRCPPGNDMREMLASGRIALRLRGRAKDIEAALDNVGVADMWPHVGVQYSIPWASHFLEMRECPDAGPADPDPMRVCLRPAAFRMFYPTMT